MLGRYQWTAEEWNIARNMQKHGFRTSRYTDVDWVYRTTEWPFYNRPYILVCLAIIVATEP